MFGLTVRASVDNLLGTNESFSRTFFDGLRNATEQQHAVHRGPRPLLRPDLHADDQRDDLRLSRGTSVAWALLMPAGSEARGQRQEGRERGAIAYIFRGERRTGDCGLRLDLRLRRGADAREEARLLRAFAGHKFSRAPGRRRRSASAVRARLRQQHVAAAQARRAGRAAALGDDGREVERSLWRTSAASVAARQAGFAGDSAAGRA